MNPFLPESLTASIRIRVRSCLAAAIIQNGAVTVMIPPERLNETASAQILELCVAHAGVGPANVRIMGFVTNTAGQM